jgi:hypothetical protein
MLFIYPAALKRHISNKSNTAAEDAGDGAASAEPAAAAAAVGALRPKTPTPGEGVRDKLINLDLFKPLAGYLP